MQLTLLFGPLRGLEIKFHCRRSKRDAYEWTQRI